MILLVDRFAKKSSYTIGRLYINGIRFCDTLEDTDRGLSQTTPLKTIQATKIYGKTAIPVGSYEIDMNTVSPKYSTKANVSFTKGYMPRLKNVPGWEGVLIHIGNSPEDTLGCILVGENKVKGKVVNSTATFTKLYEQLRKAADSGEKILLTIK